MNRFIKKDMEMDLEEVLVGKTNVELHDVNDSDEVDTLIFLLLWLMVSGVKMKFASGTRKNV